MNPNFGHVMSPVSHKLKKLQSMNYEESYEKVSILQAIWFLRRKNKHFKHTTLSFILLLPLREAKL